MPTAIISIYTSDGFVLAADGFDTDPDSGEILRTSVQKIFHVRDRTRELAFLFTGTDRICPKGSKEVIYDFIEAAKSASIALSDVHFEKSCDYANALLSRIYPLPEAARAALATHAKVPKTTIFIEGYYDGQARRDVLIIAHDDGKTDLMSGWATAGSVTGAFPDIRSIVAGSSEITLGTYRYKMSGIQTTVEAISAAWTLMYALCDAEARTVHPDAKTVGGWIHMAMITPQNGFQWIKEPRTGN